MIEYTNPQIEKWIDNHIHSARDRAILKDRFIDGLTFSELEQKHRITERQIKRIVKKADNFFITLL